MAMDWDRSGEDGGAAWWQAREERLAHADAGRIAVH